MNFNTKQLCEQAHMIEQAREAGELDQVATLRMSRSIATPLSHICCELMDSPVAQVFSVEMIRDGGSLAAIWGDAAGGITPSSQAAFYSVGTPRRVFRPDSSWPSDA